MTSDSLAIQWFEYYEDRVAPFFARCQPEFSSERTVSVAILDTGIDQDNPIIWTERHRIECKSFLGSGSEEVEDTHGHGTHVASLVLRMAKNVKVKIFRVARGNEFRLENIDSIAKVCKIAFSKHIKRYRII